ncbi:MAG TPA: hypothetical protein VMB84_16290 [Stellaceae bacterium]|nr:hypothetical protein [Stellaceae bacterium]
MSNRLAKAQAVSRHLPATVRSAYGATSIVARNWVVDLRRQCFIEMGGTSRPQDIWDSISRRLEIAEITARGVPIALRPAQARAVRRTARRIVATCVADDLRAVI